MKRTFQIYRYDPDKDAKPYMQTIEIELNAWPTRTTTCRWNCAAVSIAPTRTTIATSSAECASRWTTQRIRFEPPCGARNTL